MKDKTQPKTQPTQLQEANELLKEVYVLLINHQSAKYNQKTPMRAGVYNKLKEYLEINDLLNTKPHPKPQASLKKNFLITNPIKYRHFEVTEDNSYPFTLAFKHDGDNKSYYLKPVMVEKAMNLSYTVCDLEIAIEPNNEGSFVGHVWLKGETNPIYSSVDYEYPEDAKKNVDEWIINYRRNGNKS